jgi:hypothetical protein
MLGRRIDALHLASALIREEVAPSCPHEAVTSALSEVQSMICTSVNALSKTSPGTSQCKLLMNRLAALRQAETRLLHELESIKPNPIINE